MFPGRNQRWAAFGLIVLCRLMKKDVPVGTGVVVSVMKASSPAKQRSTEAQGQAGEPG